MTQDDTELTPEQEERLHIAIQRVRSNFLCFWARCSKAACRKARKCSADPDICMDHPGRDVPDHVREAADALIFGEFAGLPFDEVLVKAPREIAAWCEWLGKFRKSAAAHPDAAGQSKARKTPATLLPS